MPSNSNPKIKIVSKGIGRRKEAIASVRLVSGSGEIIVNDKPASEYFHGFAAAARLKLPFEVLALTKYSATARVHGGGPNGQLDSVVLGLARALSTLKTEYKDTLREHSLLTRDSRARQRRMVGMGGKSRRRKQSPKR